LEATASAAAHFYFRQIVLDNLGVLEEGVSGGLFVPHVEDGFPMGIVLSCDDVGRLVVQSRGTRVEEEEIAVVQVEMLLVDGLDVFANDIDPTDEGHHVAAAAACKGHYEAASVAILSATPHRHRMFSLGVNWGYFPVGR
jgi:hypothetical protein